MSKCTAEYVAPCWDCGEEYPVHEMSEHRVHDFDTDEPGYETYRAPLCPQCARKRQERYPCSDCGREWPSVEGSAQCCGWRPGGTQRP